jgi:rhodanese-related sulfurtransferase
MSNKKHQQKSNIRKTASRPAPAHPNNPNLKHNTPNAPVAGRKSSQKNIRKGLLGNPLLLVLIGLGVIGAIVMGAFLLNREPASANELPDTISVAEAYQKYQAGTFMLDVRTQEEWDEFHAPNTTHIPLDELEARVNELPKDQEIVVICRSGNRSQQGRDILLENGFTAVTSVEGGLKEWSAAGYPIKGSRP